MAQSSGLSQPLSVAEGGTGVTSVSDARDILLIGGLTSVGFSTFGQENDLSDLTANRTVVACDAEGTQIVLVIKSTTGDPTAKEGVLVFNTADNTLRLYAGSTWLEITFT